MIVTCPNCQTKYNLPDDKIPAGGAKVKCSKCAHVFKAELPTPEEEVETLLEKEPEVPADTKAGDEFDETFDEVAAGGVAAEPVAEESAPESPADDDDLGDLFSDDDSDDDKPAGAGDSDAADEAMSDLEGLFDDDDETPDSDEGDSPSGGGIPSAADDIESLFGDDDADDDTASGDAGGDDDDLGDLFDEDAEDDDDTGDLFEDDGADDDEEDDDDEYEDDDSSLDFDEEEPRSRKALGCLIILLVLGLGLGAAIYFKAWTLVGIDLGSYFQNVPYIGKMFMEETGGDEPVAPGESPADRVRKIELKNVKQYYVTNEKTGNLFVVEGKAVNKFATPKEQIKVEVVLYDGAQNVLTSQAFLCGNVLSQFQLQVQTQAEIEEGLSSEVGILSNNTFIRPGASTPFMAVFFQPPAGVKEFLVKVVDVGDPE